MQTDLDVVEGDLACRQLCPRRAVVSRRLTTQQLDDCFAAGHVALTDERHCYDRRAKQRLNTDHRRSSISVMLNHFLPRDAVLAQYML